MRASARLSPPDIRKLWAALAPVERAEAEARMREGKTLRKFPGGSDAASGAVRDRIGHLAGLSGRSIEKVVAVYTAGETRPELFGPVVEYLERSGNIHDAYTRMRRVADQARVAGIAPIPGRYRTLVFDPPWEDESVSENQRPPYATMPLAEIRALPVETWQLDRGHIYVHAPGPFLGIAIELVGAWGYAFKTVITWHKPRYSMGRYFRTLDEFVVFGTRGGLMTLRQDIPNHFTGPAGEHSAKPAAFYDLVRAASPGPYGEGFQRAAPPDFRGLYAPIAALEAAE